MAEEFDTSWFNLKNYEPFKTMSIMVSKAFADKRSVGEIKFPAALFSKTSTLPNFLIYNIPIKNALWPLI